MADLADFAGHFLDDGAVRLKAPPAGGEAAPILRRAWARHARAIPGPPLDLDLPTATRALELAARACWLLVSRDEPADVVAKRLGALASGDPASADLVLSRLTPVLRRARLIGPGDPLAGALETLLRRWPLSGVLADVAAGPLADPGTHPGLLLLYAERLADRPRPAWALAGPVWPYIELVFGQRGLALPSPVEPRRE